MSTHSICFHADKRKIICGYNLLSGVMLYLKLSSEQCISRISLPFPLIVFRKLVISTSLL